MSENEMKKEAVIEWMFKHPEEADESYTEYKTIANFRKQPLGKGVNMLMGLHWNKKSETEIEIHGSIFVSHESFQIYRNTVEPIFKKYGIKASFDNVVAVFQPNKSESPSKLVF